MHFFHQSLSLYLHKALGGEEQTTAEAGIPSEQSKVSLWPPSLVLFLLRLSFRGCPAPVRFIHVLHSFHVFMIDLTGLQEIFSEMECFLYHPD